ncbi:L-asparaginase II [Dendryphion nanum]|uniref:L-asparaginase II n=1 Tax=Dendryphion nanum TaxID=256645 RepID=A0A9P9DVQ0_9PLEO|nr:L-asparaginase II [Dendryphion nanum]
MHYTTDTEQSLSQATGTTTVPLPYEKNQYKSPVNDQDVIIIDRGGIIENKHQVHAAIVDANNNLLFTIGNPHRTTLIRSAAKPFQSLAIFETGAPDRYQFSDPDIALMCASHNSEPHHIARAQSMLRRTGAEEDALRCGGHPAISPAVNKTWIKQDYIPTGICNNCSGKHAGMIAGSICLDAPYHDYHEPSHPMQQRVKKVVEELSELDEKDVLWAIDGCNLPAPALPLRTLAMMFAKLANARDGNVPGTRGEYLSRIFSSMAMYPDMVGGTGRFCTALMGAYEGAVVGKVGADGCYGVGIRGEGEGEGEGRRAMGIAVKIEDGNLDMLYAAVAEILEQLGVGTAEVRGQLEGFRHPVLLNTAGVVTGKVTHGFRLKSVGKM